MELNIRIGKEESAFLLALPFPEKLMLLLKHLQKEREIDTANKRINATLPPEDITQRC